jgi:hypothetical protein
MLMSTMWKDQSKTNENVNHTYIEHATTDESITELTSRASTLTSTSSTSTHYGRNENRPMYVNTVHIRM